jgi:hypothetical protein
VTAVAGTLLISPCGRLTKPLNAISFPFSKTMVYPPVEVSGQF